METVLASHVVSADQAGRTLRIIVAIALTGVSWASGGAIGPVSVVAVMAASALRHVADVEGRRAVAVSQTHVVQANQPRGAFCIAVIISQIRAARAGQGAVAPVPGGADVTAILSADGGGAGAHPSGFNRAVRAASIGRDGISVIAGFGLQHAVAAYLADGVREDLLRASKVSPPSIRAPGNDDIAVGKNGGGVVLAGILELLDDRPGFGYGIEALDLAHRLGVSEATRQNGVRSKEGEGGAAAVKNVGAAGESERFCGRIP